MTADETPLCAVIGDAIDALARWNHGPDGSLVVASVIRRLSAALAAADGRDSHAEPELPQSATPESREWQAEQYRAVREQAARDALKGAADAIELPSLDEGDWPRKSSARNNAEAAAEVWLRERAAGGGLDPQQPQPHKEN